MITSDAGVDHPVEQAAVRVGAAVPTATRPDAAGRQYRYRGTGRRCQSSSDPGHPVLDQDRISRSSPRRSRRSLRLSRSLGVGAVLPFDVEDIALLINLRTFRSKTKTRATVALLYDSHSILLKSVFVNRSPAPPAVHSSLSYTEGCALSFSYATQRAACPPSHTIQSRYRIFYLVCPPPS